MCCLLSDSFSLWGLSTPMGSKQKTPKTGLKLPPFLAWISWAWILSILRPVTNQSYSTVQLICYNYNNNYTVPARFCSRQEHGFLCQVTSQFHCSHAPAEPAGAKQSIGKQQSWSWSKILPASIAVTETNHTSAYPPHLSRLGRLRKLKFGLAEMDGAVSHRPS